MAGLGMDGASGWMLCVLPAMPLDKHGICSIHGKTLSIQGKADWFDSEAVWICKKAIWVYSKSVWICSKAIWIRGKSVWICNKAMWVSVELHGFTVKQACSGIAAPPL